MGEQGHLHRRRPGSARSTAITAAIALGLAAGPGLIWAPAAQAAAGDGTVTVRVVREVNANGSWDQALEPGMSGVTVNLTDDLGNTISGLTTANGTVTLSPAATALTGSKYRVQVINPKPGVLFSAFAAREGLPQAPNRLSSTEEFVDLSGGKTVAYTTALWNPADYCQQNAPLVTACIRNDVSGDTGTRTLVSFPYNARGNDNQTTNLATRTQTGALYGIGYSKQKKWIFSGATAHRGSAYGPGNQGGIYVTDRATNTTTLYATVPDAGGTAHKFTMSTDLAFTPAVGKESLGDVEVSEDGKDLYVVNLANRKLYRYDATVKTADEPKAMHDIPQPETPCPAPGDWRPYGLGIQDGVVYVGGVCSGESTQKVADMRAIVRTFDPAIGRFGTVIMDQKLDFPRLASFSGGRCPGNGWYPWNDSVNVYQGGLECYGLTANPEPMLSDIIVDTSGDLILSFRDRYADQIGNAQHYKPGSTATPASGGALTRACADATGQFVMAENQGCGKTTSGARYYEQQRTVYHYNAFHGGTALSKVETTIATSAIDPTEVTYTGGTSWVNRDGTRPAAGQLGNQLTTAFGKGGSMADLEVMCDEAPLQIGNRVWYDVDKDGIQDPSEAPVPGATVNLYDSTGTLAGTMRTTARGEYYFDNSNVPSGLKPNTQYTIKIDNPADYASGGPLFQWTVTQANAGSNDFIDSDGTVPSGGTYPEHSITTGGPGQDNHTYDFGYSQPEGFVTVVKQDQDGNPLAGAVFQLWKESNGTAGLQTGGTPDTKLGATCTTGANGVCQQTVPLGTYYWQETQAPPNYLLPAPAIFGPLTLTMANFALGVSVPATNTLATGEVRVLKKDEGGKALAGAVFQLWKESNGTAGLQPTGAPDTIVGATCTTGSDGLCKATVPLGTYYWQETLAPDGYLLPDPAVFGPLELTMANRTAGVSAAATNVLATGRVRVTKKDTKGNALGGAVFQLWRETNGTNGLQTDGDTKVGSACTTNPDGICDQTVPLGTYYWQETRAPDGYLLPDPAVFGPLDLTMANRTAGAATAATNALAEGEVKVAKQDEAGRALAGAVFQLWRESNGIAGLQTTGADPDTAQGSPCTTGTDGSCAQTVPLGTYYWQETQAPGGYLLPDDPVFGPLVLTMANRTTGVSVRAINVLATGEVSVVKQDASGSPLAGATFQLWKDANDVPGLQTDADTKVGPTCLTPVNGVCAQTVPLGTYYWQETQAPDGYLLPDPAVFGPLALTMANRTQGATVTAANVLATGEVKVVKQDEGAKALAGAIFQLWKETNGTSGLQTDDTPDTKVEATCTTGADGICAATVPLGTYYWQELQAPAGYLLPDPAVFGPLALTMANRTQGVSVPAINVLATGEVRVSKQDGDGKALAGAVFQLWRDTDGTNGLQIAADTKVGAACTTGADGVCKMTVPLGTYYWEETQAPAGYLLPDPAVAGPLELTMANRTQGATSTVKNILATGEVRVSKQDGDGKALAGAVFQLWRDTDGTNGLQTDGDTQIGGACTTGTDGMCRATVPLGTYYWQETQAPAGYLLPDPAVFGPLELTMANRTQGATSTVKNILATGEVRVSKQDGDGKALAGAVFQLWRDTNGTSGLQMATDTKVGAACTTGADGMCRATVPLGTYYWEETQAPAGYLLPDPAVAGPLQITMVNLNQGASITATNVLATGDVSVLKRGSDGKILAGAVFQLWRESNGATGLQFDGPAPDTKVGAEYTTDADGICKKTVPLGSYYWQEISPPPGYVMQRPGVLGPLVLTMANRAQGASITALNDEMTIRTPGEVAVVKKDPLGNRLAGAVFQLWQESNGTGGLQADGDTKVGSICTTKADGECVRLVPIGTYYWQEISAPPGHLMPSPAVFGPLELTKDNLGVGVSYTAVNEPRPGEIRLLKRSVDDGKPLAGAVFQLWRESNGLPGLQIEVTADTKAGQVCVTDAQGECDFPALVAGTYYLLEIAAPPGYQLPAKKINGPYALNPGDLPLEVQVSNGRLPITGMAVPIYTITIMGLVLLSGGVLLRGLTRRRTS